MKIFQLNIRQLFLFFVFFGGFQNVSISENKTALKDKTQKGRNINNCKMERKRL